MTAAEFEARTVSWAKRQGDIQALVLGGSRAKPGNFDCLSDWDFQLIASRPGNYYDTRWLNEIAQCWCAYAERTPRGVMKVSAIFSQGFEADFVLLSAWQMKLVYAGMRRPHWRAWMPDRIQRGIHETRAFMLGSGYQLLVGDETWVQRFSALKEPWPQLELSAKQFAGHLAAFWPKAVWIYKKILRPELRSAMHWLHLLILNHVYPLLAEEARLEGHVPRPEARKAELWLNARRLEQTVLSTALDQRLLATALLIEMRLFQEVTQSVAARREFAVPDYTLVTQWLFTELEKLTD